MIIQSNHPPTTNISFPLSHVPQCNIQCPLNTRRDSNSIASLGSPLQRLTTHWEKVFTTNLTASLLFSGHTSGFQGPPFSEGFRTERTRKQNTYLESTEGVTTNLKPFSSRLHQILDVETSLI